MLSIAYQYLERLIHILTGGANLQKSLLLALMLCTSASYAQQDISNVASGNATAISQPAPSPMIKRDTPLELMATKEVSTADAVAGTKFKLRLNKPIIVDNITTIPVGTWAHGEVVTASDAGGLGKSGKMTARLLYLEFGTLQIPIDGSISAKGTGAGAAGAAVIFSGLAGLFHRGNNAKIKAGEIVNAFVAEDTAVPSVGG